MDTRSANSSAVRSPFVSTPAAQSSALAEREAPIALSPGLWSCASMQDGRFELVIERRGFARVRAMILPSFLLAMFALLLSLAVWSLLSLPGSIGATLSLLCLAAVSGEAARRRALDAFEGGRYTLDATALTVDCTTLRPRDARPTTLATEQIYGFCGIPEGPMLSLGVITRDGEVVSMQSNERSPVVVASLVDQLNAALRALRAARSYR